MSEFNGILTLTVFLPALAALIILVTRPLKLDDGVVRWFAMLSAAATFVLSLVVFLLYDRDAGGVQLVDHVNWLSAETIKSSYLLGVDGLSAPLVLLTCFSVYALSGPVMQLWRRHRGDDEPDADPA